MATVNPITKIAIKNALANPKQVATASDKKMALQLLNVYKNGMKYIKDNNVSFAVTYFIKYFAEGIKVGSIEEYYEYFTKLLNIGNLVPSEITTLTKQMGLEYNATITATKDQVINDITELEKARMNYLNQLLKLNKKPGQTEINLIKKRAQYLATVYDEIKALKAEFEESRKSGKIMPKDRLNRLLEYQRKYGKDGEIAQKEYSDLRKLYVLKT